MSRAANPGSPVPIKTAARWRRWPVLLVVMCLSITAGWAGRRMQDSRRAESSSRGTAATAAEPPSKSLSAGAVLFQVHCAKCHGPDGRGDPEAIARLRPPPRDFAERPWRFEMTVDSIRRVIADGIPGTSMAAQRAALAATDLDLLADYVLHLARDLPVVERSFTPEQQELAELGFEIERRPLPAPKLTIENPRGQSRSLSDLQGAWVILEFWSVSCEPCRRAMPALQRLSITGFGQHLTILPVCVDADDAQAAQDVMLQIAPGLTAYVESSGLGIAQFNVQALPMTWLVDPQGQVCATLTGRIDWDSKGVQAALEKMVLRNGSPKNL